MRESESLLSTMLLKEEIPRVFSPDIELTLFFQTQSQAIARIQEAEVHCLRELEDLQLRAKRQGYQAGLQQVLVELDGEVKLIKQVASQHRQQIVELIIQCIKKICGDLPADVLVPKMIQKVLDEQVDAVQVNVSVHPEIGQVLSSLNLEGVSIDANAELGLTDARIESSEFIKSVSLHKQISRLQQQLHTDDEP